MHPIPQDTKHPKKEKNCRFNKQEEEEEEETLWKSLETIVLIQLQFCSDWG